MAEDPSARLSEPIAEGRIAEVYAWGDGQVLKLARDWVPPGSLAYEYRIARQVFETGLPIPEPHELIEVDGREGIVYTRVDGPTMLDRIGRAPHKAGSFGRTLGRLHAEMHAETASKDLPEAIARLERKTRSVSGAPVDLQKSALDALSGLPRGTALLHGDFHPGNVVLTEEGAVVIDWPDAARGHPLADVARTVVLINMGGLPRVPVLRQFIQLLRKVFEKAYLRTYFRTSPLQRKDLDAWLFPVLFARLSEDIESERSQVASWLARLHRN